MLLREIDNYYFYDFQSEFNNRKTSVKYLCCLTAPGDICKSSVKTADKNLIFAICEYIHKVMNGNVKISKILLNKLKPDKDI